MDLNFNIEEEYSFSFAVGGTLPSDCAATQMTALLNSAGQPALGNFTVEDDDNGNT